MISEIYCYGGMEIYRDVFNAISMLNGDRSFIQTLFSLALLVGTVWGIVTMIAGDLIKPFKSWMIPMAVIQTLFLTPTKTVHLIDVVQRTHTTVDHVPFGLALIAGSLSRISHKITEKVEMYFSLPNELKYSKTGGIFAANLLANQKLMTIQDEDFAENMRGFIGQCVLYDVALGRKYTLKDLRHTHDIWGLVSQQASPARSFIWKESGNRGEIVTCRDGVVRFNHAWSHALNKTACATGAALFPTKDSVMSSLNASESARSVQAQENQDGCRSPLARQEFLRFLPGHYGVLAGMANGTDALKQHMMIAAIVDAQDHASVMAGNASNFAARKAYFQQRSSYETIGKLASDTLPVMRAALELVCYALFLFIMPLLILPYGYKTLVAWSQTILWLAMWPPMYAILHLIMVSAIAYKTRAYIGISNPSGITIASSLGVQNISSDMAAMAGYLSMSIPFICIAIVKGVSSFVHMSSSLGAVSQGASSSAATEGLTGNYQLGNTSLDNHSFSTISMLREGYNGNLSQGTMMMQDGHVGISSSVDGHNTMTIEQSSLPVSANVAQRLSSNLRTAANHEMSMGTSHIQSADKHIEFGLQNTATLANTLINSTNTQKVYGEMTSQEVGHSMQKIDQAADKLSKDEHISKGRAFQLLASVGSPEIVKMFSPLSGGIQLQSNSENRETIAKAKEIAKHFNFDENARITAQASEHLSKTESHDTITNLAREQQHSFREASSEMQSAQKHFEKSQRLTKEAEYTQANEASINRNYNDKLIDFISAHKSRNGRDDIGKKEAGNILRRNNEETAIFIDRFMKQITPHSPVSTHETDLRKNFDNTKIESFVNKDNVDHFYQQNTSTLKMNRELETENIENRVHGKVAETKEFISGAKTDMIDPSMKNLQKEHERRSTDVGAVTSVKEAFYASMNLASSPIKSTIERVQDIQEFYTNIGKGKKQTTDYSDFSETLKGDSFDSQTSNKISSTDHELNQPTKVIKIKKVPTSSKVESILKEGS